MSMFGPRFSVAIYLAAFVAANAKAGTDFTEAAAARYGATQIGFLDSFVKAKPEEVDRPARSLLTSFLLSNSADSRPPMDFSAMAMDPALTGEVWLSFAEDLYDEEQFDRAELALAKIPDSYRTANATRISALQLKLHLRRGGKFPEQSGPASTDPLFSLNLALANLKSGDQTLVQSESISRLRRLASDQANSVDVRNRASIWIALLHRHAGETREAIQALSAIDGDAPLLADVLLAYLRVDEGLHPIAASVVERQLAGLAPDSPMHWEAREHLLRALLAKKAFAQASEGLRESVDSVNRSLVRIDQQILAAEEKPLAEALPLLSLLPEGYGRRASALAQRKANLLAAAEVLKTWRPHIESYLLRLQKAPEQFASEIKEEFGSSHGGGTDSRTDANLKALFNLELTKLVGSPPDSHTAYRLFSSLAQWEFGVTYPEAWRLTTDVGQEPSRRPGRREKAAMQRREREDRTFLPTALDHVNKLLGKVNTQMAKTPGFLFYGMADRAKAISSRGLAQILEIHRVVPLIDSAIRQELVQGLKERRQIAQQWLNRFAFHARELQRRSTSGSEQIYFDLSKPFSPKKGESLVLSMEKLNGPGEKRKATDVNTVYAWSALKSLIADGQTREIRADALRLRAELTLDLYEAQTIPSAGDAVAHYRELLAEYSDLVDRADVTYQLARAQDLSQQTDRSLATLTDFVKTYRGDPRSGEAYFRIGEIEFAVGESARAKSAYEQVLRAGESRYLDQAQYKLAWTLFKQGNYHEALPKFIAVMDRAIGDSASNDKQREERARDAFRAVTLAFSHLDGAPDIERFFARAGTRSYVPELYHRLAAFYLEHDRINDASSTYAYLTKHHPTDTRAPTLLASIVKGARKENLARLSLDLQEQFVSTYASGRSYWEQAGADVRGQVNAEMQPFLAELAELYHSGAQQDRNPATYAKAIQYYGQYIATFPKDVQTPVFQFLMAEARFETGDYVKAMLDYEKAAYDYGNHEKAAEAGYASLIASQKLAEMERDPIERKKLLRALVKRSSRFASTFVGDARVDAVLVKASEDILMLGEADEAARLGESLLARAPGEVVQRRAWIVTAHGYFESKAFARAEKAYLQALAFPDNPLAVQNELRGRLGLSVYRQAEAYRAEGKATLAIDNFLRVAKLSPGADFIPNAEIDAAALLLSERRWGEAIDVFERFLKDFPTSKFAGDIPTKLAYAYENDGRFLQAADMLERLSESEKDFELGRQMLLRSAELREKAQRTDLSVATFERYLKRYPSPLEPAIEIRQTLADIAVRSSDMTNRDRWLREIITAHAKAGGEETPRMRFLAAQANIVFADAKAAEFDVVKLRLPLDKSLLAKRQAMESALKWYDEAGRYGVVEVTTGATYKTAELYRRLAKDLLSSERPEGLSALETEQYNVLLEEEAFPFEEKSTKVHEINHARIRNGVYDQWVRWSLESLRSLVPGRYDKMEFAGGHFDYVPPKPPDKPETKPKQQGGEDAATGK